MNRRYIGYGAGIFITLSVTAPASQAVERVSRLMNFVDFYVGGSTPVGERDGLPDVEFSDFVANAELNSDKVYENTFHMGVTYGQLRSHFLWSIGLHYTDHRPFDLIELSPDTSLVLNFNPTYRQLDINFGLNAYLLDIMKSGFSPYAGLAVRGGIMRIDDDVNEADYTANLGMSVNFGADLKLWSAADARSFVTLSSVNSYDFYGSSDRPNYLNIGGAIKYYFSP
jgi:hypothetical protein